MTKVSTRIPLVAKVAALAYQTCRESICMDVKRSASGLAWKLLHLAVFLPTSLGVFYEAFHFT